MRTSMKDKRGMMWTMGEKAICQIVAFAQGVVLARLLSPGDFGLTAMLAVFIGVGEVLVDGGLGIALVVKGRGREVERKAFLWNIGVALSLYAVFALGAPAIAKWYNEPILSPILRVMAIGMVINATSVVTYARLMRHEQFGRIAIVNTLSIIAGMVVAIAMALGGMGVWAIVGVGIGYAVVRTLGAWIAARGLEETRGEGSAREVFGLGIKYTLSNIIWAVYQNLWQIVIGKLWSPASVGLFTRGKRWANLPSDIVNDTVGRVALPNLVKKPDGAIKYFRINCLLLWPALGVVYVFAEEIVGFILGAQWLDAVPYLRILIWGAAVTPIGNIAMKIIQASGRGEYNLYCDAIKRPLGIVYLIIGAKYGIVGLCWAYVASEVTTAIVNLGFALKWKEPAFDIDFVFTYYGGTTPPEGVDKCRACDNGELKYAIASVKKYAPWYRKIFVLVNDGTVKPSYITDDIAWVEHKEVMAKEVLPLYNTAAIEMWLHKISNLSEHFIYANDDMFVGRRVRKSDFFTYEGKMICRFSGYGELKTLKCEGSVYPDMLRYGRKVLEVDDEELPHHNMTSLTKTDCAAIERDFPDEWKKSASERYRIAEQVTIDAICEYALKRGTAIRRWCDRGGVRIRRMLGLCAYFSLYAELRDRKTIEFIRKVRPKLYCLNDTENCTDEDRKLWVIA